MLKKWFVALVGVLLSVSLSFADAVFLKDGSVKQGRIVGLDGSSVILQSDAATFRLLLSEIKGFCYDGQPAVYQTASGTKIGSFEGVNEKEAIFLDGFQYSSVELAALQTVYPAAKRAAAQTVAGMQNGLMISGYTPLNREIAAISSGSVLPTALYAAGAYVETFRSVTPRFSMGFGAALAYIPTATVTLATLDTQTEFGSLSVDTIKGEVTVGGYFSVLPALKIGVSVTPSVNVSSIYETFTTNSIEQNIYLTHSTVGIRPALEVRYTLFDTISLGLTAGYEVLSTCDGVVLRLQTGYAF